MSRQPAAEADGVGVDVAGGEDVGAGVGVVGVTDGLGDTVAGVVDGGVVAGVVAGAVLCVGRGLAGADVVP